MLGIIINITFTNEDTHYKIGEVFGINTNKTFTNQINNVIKLSHMTISTRKYFILFLKLYSLFYCSQTRHFTCNKHFFNLHANSNIYHFNSNNKQLEMLWSSVHLFLISFRPVSYTHLNKKFNVIYMYSIHNYSI